MSLAQQLRDYRLTTAEILYHLPDHPAVLQTYIWQELDLAPKISETPSVSGFLVVKSGWQTAFGSGWGVNPDCPTEMEHAPRADAALEGIFSDDRQQVAPGGNVSG